jgi:hypothetical protein
VPSKGAHFAAEHGMMFIDTSAKSNINVDTCFRMLASRILEKFFPASSAVVTEEQDFEANRVDLTKIKTSTNESCCK